MSFNKDHFFVKLILWCDVAVGLGKEDYEMFLLRFSMQMFSMSNERSKRNVKEKFGLILIKEGGFETKTVASMKWVDLENAKLWPSGSNVKIKKNFNPDKDTWESYPLLDVLLEGKLNIFFYSSGITKT